jgi:hypothetical protein
MIVVAATQWSARRVEIDVAVALVVEELRPARSIEENGRRPHRVLRKRFVSFEDIHREL